MAEDTLRLAVLIDADNASAAVIGDILAEVAALGTASVKRIYGDFTTTSLNGWKAVLAEHAIQPVQQFRNTTGKNATDSALIIDAMDLLHTRELGGFCLVSSDSDFTRLATRIRENGLPVYGFGEQKTPSSFIKACDRFTYTEIFKAKRADSSAKTAAAAAAPLRNLKGDEDFIVAFDQSVEAATRDDGRAHLGAVGSHLLKLLPDFDARNYGFQKLSELVETIPGYGVVREKTAGGNPIEYVERK
ncbi:MAG TPA: NYN domain-containing protein [Stellaceae bacterium]|nr:NYN domain-containing protein [Stellaceae bacterium]